MVDIYSGGGKISVSNKDRVSLQEEFKGETTDEPVTFPKTLGAKHPYNFEDVEKLYIKYGLVAGIVNKFTDSTITNFEIKLGDEEAQEFIEEFIKTSQLSTKLRDWVREGWLKGNGFMEIDLTEQKVRVMNANNMYVVRNKKGKVLNYNQWTRNLKFYARDSPELIQFNPNQIAHLTINKIPNDPYGIGAIFPNERIIENLVKNEQDQQKIVSRKAGSPYHIKVGQPGSNVPQNIVDDIKSKLVYLTNTTEWVTDGDVEISAISFGDLGKSLTESQMYFYRMLLAGTEMPEVLMGSGQLNEGIAKVQVETFNRKITSIRNEIADIISEKIIKPILESKGYDSSDIEFSWDLPSEDDKNARISVITTLLSIVSPTLKAGLEIELAKLLGLEELEETLDTPEDAKVNAETDKQNQFNLQKQKVQPETPNNFNNFNHSESDLDATESELNEFVKKSGNEWCVFSHKTGKKISCYSSEEEAKKALARMEMFKHIHSEEPEIIETENENENEVENKTEAEDIILKDYIDIQEVSGFNYTDYLVKILEVIKEDDFTDLAGRVEEDFNNGLLTETEIKKLRVVLSNAFKQNMSISQIEKALRENIDFKDRITETGTTPAENRPITIARTETIRVANQGTINLYKDNNIKKVQFVAAISPRTCEICMDLNGVIFNINELTRGINQPDIHPNCRCRMIAVFE
jgi:SPP1 gp7 family putative phage head morphogenesis protein